MMSLYGAKLESGMSVEIPTRQDFEPTVLTCALWKEITDAFARKYGCDPNWIRACLSSNSNKFKVERL